MHALFRSIMKCAASAALAVSVVLAIQALPAGAQPASPSCAGVPHGMTRDYVITGSHFQPGRNYVVGITLPSASTFYTVATATSTGGWGEYWLPDTAGTYSANVYAYQLGTLGKWITVCSFQVT